MSVLNDIRVALENHLATTPAPALPAIAWPNVPFVRTEGTPFIHVEFLPVTRRPAVVGPNPEHRISGLFYMTIYTPEDRGASSGMLLADRLVTRFNGSSAIVAPNVTVRLEYSEVKSPLHEPPFFVIPVETGWFAFKP